MAYHQLIVVCIVVLAAFQLTFTAPQQSLTVTETNSTPAVGIAKDSDKDALAPVLGKIFWLDKCDNLLDAMPTWGINETSAALVMQYFNMSVLLEENKGNYNLTVDIGVKFDDEFSVLRSKVSRFRFGQEYDKTTNDGVSKILVTRNGTAVTETKDGMHIFTMNFSPEDVKAVIQGENITLNCEFKSEQLQGINAEVQLSTTK